MPQSDFPKARQQYDVAQKQRAIALEQVRKLAQTGQRNRIIPFLFASMRKHPALEKIRLWQLDAMMFNTGRDRALRTIRKTRDLIHDSSTMPDGYCNLAWATETPDATIRLAAWLYELSVREERASFSIPDDIPYGWMYDTDPDQTA